MSSIRLEPKTYCTGFYGFSNLRTKWTTIKGKKEMTKYKKTRRL